MSKIILRGISASFGLAEGQAYVLTSNINNYFSPKSDFHPDKEVQRFKTVINNYLNELDRISKNIAEFDPQKKTIIQATTEILSDTEVNQQIIENILKGFSVEESVNYVFENYIQLLKTSKKSSFLKKATELELIKNRILEHLNSSQIAENISIGSIVVANSISVEQLFFLKDYDISGIITEFPGLTTHTSILARSFKIPEIIGIQGATSMIHTNDYLLLDAYQGEVIVEPNEDEIEEFKKKIAEENQIIVSLGSLVDLPTKTRDNKEILLQVNLNLIEELNNPVVFYSDGVGLVRTEHLIGQINKFLDGKNFKTFENFQYEKYFHLAQKIYPKEVTFRVFDYGADKNFGLNTHYEPNPMLGLRGIRLLLANKKLFKTQIRALLRASSLRNIKIMLPMITNIEEVKESVQIINECLLDLINSGEDVDHNIKIGVMIETPAAVLISEVITDYVDFFSIGTNDLTQYILAADRNNPLVVRYSDPFHPAVLKMIKLTVDNAKRKNKPVGICGELASHPSATTILVGLGLDSISVNPDSFLQVKKWISQIDYNQSVEIVKKTLSMETYEDVRKFLSIY